MVNTTGSLSGGPDANTERVGRPGERRGSVEETQTTAILDDIAGHAASGNDRLLAFWNLGRLAEKDCDFQRAIEN